MDGLGSARSGDAGALPTGRTKGRTVRATAWRSWTRCSPVRRFAVENADRLPEVDVNPFAMRPAAGRGVAAVDALLHMAGAEPDRDQGAPT